MFSTDIDAFLRREDKINEYGLWTSKEVKELCEEMYHNGEISRTGNYRYFVLTEEKEKSKKTSAPK
jgi:hypothetical protein